MSDFRHIFDKTEEIGKRIGETRKKKGITQVELAEMLHIGRDTLSRWENGERYLHVDDLADISKALDVDIGNLLGLYEERTYPIHEISRQTDLTEEAIASVLGMTKEQTSVLSVLLSDKRFLDILNRIQMLSDFDTLNSYESDRIIEHFTSAFSDNRIRSPYSKESFKNSEMYHINRMFSALIDDTTTKMYADKTT